jgi:hypothetical protein
MVRPDGPPGRPEGCSDEGSPAPEILRCAQDDTRSGLSKDASSVSGVSERLDKPQAVDYSRHTMYLTQKVNKVNIIPNLLRAWLRRLSWRLDPAWVCTFPGR